MRCRVSINSPNSLPQKERLREIGDLPLDPHPTPLPGRERESTIIFSWHILAIIWLPFHYPIRGSLTCILPPKSASN